MRRASRATAIAAMKYPPALVAAAIAAIVLLLLSNTGADSPCRSSFALRVDGLCGAAAFYLGPP